MRDIKSIYPDLFTDGFSYGPSSYGPLIQALGFVKLRVDEQNYQGDSHIILEESGDGYGRIGFLTFGWGSCTGCDALQACESYEELDALRKELSEKIRWFESNEKLLEFLNTHDWQVEAIGDRFTFDKFLKAAKIILSDEDSK